MNAVLVAAAIGLVVLGVTHIPPAPTVPRYEAANRATPRSGGTFVYYARDNIRTFDPHFAYDQLSLIGIRLLFDGLLDYDADGHLIPSLAEAMPDISEDGLTFTFRIRHGVRFHDGSELTSEDIRWSMHRLLAPATSSPAVPFYLSIVGADAYASGEATSIRGIRVVDRYAIEFTLKEADQTFLNVMAMHFAYPMKRSVVERYGNRVGIHPVGTGPFRLERWERGVEVRFQRHARHFQHNARVDRIVLIENLDATIAVARFQNGDVDLLTSMSNAHHRFFKSSRAWARNRWEEPDVMVSGLTMNCEMAPFDDVHVRRAVAYALDRRSRSRLANGRTQPAGQPIPPQLAGYDPNIPGLQQLDLVAARREMALAGHPNGLKRPIQVIVGEGDDGRQSVELLQQELTPIGIRVEGRAMSFAQYLEETGRRGRAQAFLSAWSMDFPDPSNFLDPLFHSRSIHDVNSENRSFYVNRDLDQLLDRARAERDAATRVAMYREANAIVARDAPWAFIANRMSLEVAQPYVRNYRPHPVWFADVRNLWLDLPRHRVPFAAIVTRPFARTTR